MNFAARLAFPGYIAPLAMCATALLNGCVADPPQAEQQTVYVCYERGHFQNTEFAYACSDRERARTASEVCDFMAASAHAMVETNRRVGPTTPEHLLTAAGIERMDAFVAIRRALGEGAFKTYLEYLASMSIEIANRNITDLVVYPQQQLAGCLKEFNYAVRAKS
jgi:hypothetical protein